MIPCEHLSKRFGHFTAVDGVSFSVGKGAARIAFLFGI